MPQSPRRLVTAVSGLSAAGCLLLAGCGAGEADAELSPEGFEAEQAENVLAEFDEGDSAATASGDPEQLRRWETEPLIDLTVAASRSAQATGEAPSAFTHVSPQFALPENPSSSPCFLSTAELDVEGQGIASRNVMHFVADGKSNTERPSDWLASHAVVVADDVTPALLDLTDATVVDVAETIDAERLGAIEAGVYGRSIGEPVGNGGEAAVAESVVLDGRLAQGVSVYKQELEAQGAQFERELTDSSWSSCGAQSDAGLIAFLDLEATDTLMAAEGDTVQLPMDSPDAAATGQTEPLTGAQIEVERRQLFLLLIPDEENAQAVVLGLNDAATSAGLG